MRRSARVLALVAVPLTLFAAACGLSLSVDEVAPTLDGAPGPTGTNTSRPPVDAGGRDVAVPGDAEPVTDATSDAADASDGASDASDASDAGDASDGASDASDGAADSATDSATDASDASVTLPAAAVVLRFETAVAPFINDANAGRAANEAMVTSSTDAPTTGAAPATNTRSISLATNTRAWAKISPAADLAKVTPVTALTVAAWVKPAATVGLATIVSYSSVRGGVPLFELSRTSTSGVSFVMGGLLSTAGAPIVDAPSAFLTADGTWKFVAVTYDRAASRACFYKGSTLVGGDAALDGSCVAYANRQFTPATDRTSALVVGNSADEDIANPVANNVYIPSFGGSIDQVFVYFEALTAAQIRVVQKKNDYP